MFEAGVGDNVHDFRAIGEFVQLVEGEKTGAGEIGFLAENAIKFDGVSDRFVDLQAELAAVKKQSAGFFRALRRGMECYGLFGDAWGVPQKIERSDLLLLAARVPVAFGLGQSYGADKHLSPGQMNRKMGQIRNPSRP